MNSFPQLILKSGRQRSVINQHPWVFSGAVKDRPKAGPGSVVEVRDNAGELLGYGHYAPESQIICRMFAFGNQVRAIDEAFWLERLRHALVYRRATLDFAQISGYRLINAEGDNLPGIIIDVFGKVASIQVRTMGAAPLMPVLKSFLQKEAGITHLYFSYGKGQEQAEGWDGEAPKACFFEEYGLKFNADIAGGQKTGFFLDQRENRHLVREYAPGKSVLDMFCYSGGFSVNSLAGKAARVVSVDVSAGALDLVRQNAALNGFADSGHEGVKADAFNYLKEMPEGEFDLIILDPPAFTKSIKTVPQAARGYKEINLKAFQKIRPGGLLFTFSCSQHMTTDLFRKVVFGAAADSGRSVRIITQLTQAPDHPINIYHPEGEYLKGLLLFVE
ncbi:MAG: class I SAM-dependent rRNA methyltransferase [Bacteroidia bacterium]|nr:class I SAM-dependent rRNA methyltransferase [Bacteroidia bacterium]